MNEQTKLALIKFTKLVAVAITNQANGKDVDWCEVLAPQEALATAMENDPA